METYMKRLADYGLSVVKDSTPPVTLNTIRPYINFSMPHFSAQEQLRDLTQTYFSLVISEPEQFSKKTGIDNFVSKLSPFWFFNTQLEILGHSFTFVLQDFNYIYNDNEQEFVSLFEQHKNYFKNNYPEIFMKYTFNGSNDIYYLWQIFYDERKQIDFILEINGELKKLFEDLSSDIEEAIKIHEQNTTF